MRISILRLHWSNVLKLPVVVVDPTTGDQPIFQLGPRNSCSPRRFTMRTRVGAELSIRTGAMS
jgi:hypothetical protein